MPNLRPNIWTSRTYCLNLQDRSRNAECRLRPQALATLQTQLRYWLLMEFALQNQHPCGRRCRLRAAREARLLPRDTGGRVRLDLATVNCFRSQHTALAVLLLMRHPSEVPPGSNRG